MKKIGIVTFHRAKNYGAMLQAYALQETLGQYFDASIVDYRSPRLEKQYYKHHATLKKKIKGIAKWILQTKYMYSIAQKDRMFDKFQRDFYLTEEKYTPDNIKLANEKYDCFISGSDQIWNMTWSDHDWNYYLEFAEDGKKYSYAASMGTSFPEEERDRVRNDVMRYNSVLVREQQGKNLLQSIGVEKDICVTCDPVFLLSQNEWIRKLGLHQRTKKKKRGYLLFYYVAEPTNALEFASTIAIENDWEIVLLNIRASKETPENVKSVIEIGPKEFLEYILDAEMVVTTSFHAMAFSLILNKPFYYELCRNKSNNNDRLIDLAAVCGVSDREITMADQQYSVNMEWQSINEKLNSYAIKSKKTLLHALNEIGGVE